MPVPSGLIGAEPHPPYDRPPLSKGLWKDKALTSIWLPLEKNALTLHLGRTAQTLDAGRKSVVDDQGAVYMYGDVFRLENTAKARCDLLLEIGPGAGSIVVEHIWPG